MLINDSQPLEAVDKANAAQANVKGGAMMSNAQSMPNITLEVKHSGVIGSTPATNNPEPGHWDGELGGAEANRAMKQGIAGV